MRAANAFFLLIIGIWIACQAILALRNGIARAHNGCKYPRRERPTMYWTVVLIQVVAAGWLVCVAYQLLRQLLE